MWEQTRFIIFCLENYKVPRQLTGNQVFELFKQHNVFDYLIEFYDVLHTTGHKYINHDIDIYLKSRNVSFQ